jgi:hypothetical protein
MVVVQAVAGSNPVAHPQKALLMGPGFLGERGIHSRLMIVVGILAALVVNAILASSGTGG